MSYLITGKTRVCALFGDPVEHAMSPVMHNAAFQKLGLDDVYVPFRVSKEDLGKAVAGVRAMNLRGFNVTIPHKMAVIPFLDKLDVMARKLGAVNTVVNDSGILTGYNTDATGFLQSLLEKEIEPKGKRITVLGAGGSARAIVLILAERGAQLTIMNRHLERARELAKDISQNVKALTLNDENLSAVMVNTEILINCTSVGMQKESETPAPARLLHRNLVVVDIVYNPIETRLLREARSAGARTIGGVEMLVWQGAQGFEKWTGQKPPVDLMRKEAIKALTHEK
jgi:shikimate dehydrogenase